MTQTTTNEDILRLVDLLELQIKICDCSAGSKYDMLDKIDNIHSVIHNTKRESANIKDEDIKVNVKYELDKEAYRQYVADMDQIEAEFKANNRSRKFIAGEELEEGDLVYKHPDGKMYKSDCIPANIKDVCEWWIETYPENVFYSAPIQIIEIRKHMKVILDNLK